MKTIHYSCMLLITMLLAGIFTSCEKENLSNNGEPRIRYIRITSPESADSLLVGAYQSNLIAIVGENLQDATEIWFNDQKAFLTPTYITNTSILVSVPSQIPIEITNKMKIIFSNGKELMHDFTVEISEPLINSMNCEYVAEGGTAVIRGDYFYAPVKVTFTGGVEGEVINLADDRLSVVVPAGAEPGPITITTNFGETVSDFWFRDNRNIFISSDPFTGWWNASFVVSNPSNDDPPAINGNYIRVNKAIGGWNWLEVAGGPPDAMGPISKNIPDEAILKPADYNLKFEVNTRKPYNNNMIKLNVGLANDFNNNQYLWAPPYDTQGEWQTVVIPFEEIADSYGAPLTVNPNGYYTRVLFHGAGDLDCDMSFDNFRVVPKVLK
ncbi:MAG: glycan-binding surface protein [Agriterribacter sp.]